MSLVLAFVGVVALTVCVGVLAYARGYKAGVAYCLGALEPTVELLNTFQGALAPTSALRHHVSEEMRRTMERRR